MEAARVGCVNGRIVHGRVVGGRRAGRHGVAAGARMHQEAASGSAIDDGRRGPEGTAAIGRRVDWSPAADGRREQQIRRAIRPNNLNVKEKN